MGQGAAFVDALRRCWGVQLAHGASCWWESTDFYGAMGSFDEGISNSSGFSSMSARGTAATSPALPPRGGAPPAVAVPAAPLSMDVLPGATTSACHAWGSYPTVAMQRWLLGVRPAAAGFTRVVVAPLVGLGGGWLQRVSGDVPTPLGTIRVAAVAAAVQSTSAAATLSISIDAPAGVAGVEVQLPRVLPGVALFTSSPGGCSLTSIDVDGSPIQASLRRDIDAGSGRTAVAFDLPVLPVPKPLQRRPRGSGAAQAHTLVRVVTASYGPSCADSSQSLRGASGGPSSSTGRRQPVPVAPVAQGVAESSTGSAQAAPMPVALAASPRALPFPTPWPLSVSIDSSTHGAWLKRGLYGRQGYVLFAYDKGRRGTAVDRTSLPPSVSVSLPSGVQRSLSNTSSVATAKLQDPAHPSGPRRLGAAFVTGNSLYNLWVDINTTTGTGTTRTAAPGRAGSNQVYNLWVDVNASSPPTATTAAAPQQARTGPFAVTLYVADTRTPAGQAPSYPAPSLVLHVEDLVTRNALAADTTVRRYVPPPAYGGQVPPWNAAGTWGLEAGLMLRVQPVTAPIRLRVYCVAGCYASVSAVFLDPIDPPPPAPTAPLGKQH